MREAPDRNRFPEVGDGTGIAHDERFHREELQLALRNRGMPLEGLRYPVTPTGMHYLLVHYDIPEIDPASWRLELGGRVERPLSLSLAEIQERPVRTLTVTLECAGNGRALSTPRRISQPWHHEAIGTAQWTGTPLRELLDEAGLTADAREIVFTGLDRGVEGGVAQSYQRSLELEEARRDEVLLAWAMNGAPLEPQHGFPLRLIVPGWYGMASVKWLGRIDAVSEPFEGYQMRTAYRYSGAPDELGDPVDLVRVRSLMIPPGVPDFLTRTRLVEAGPVRLRGRAWAGRREVARVEVSADGGGSWWEAELGEPVSPHAWREWAAPWEATPGTHTLCVRATDSEGETQPLEPAWNYGGYGNNAVQRVRVVVE